MVGLSANKVIGLVKGSFSCMEDGQVISYASSKETGDQYGEYDIVTAISVVNDEILLKVQNVEEEEKARIRANQERFIREHKKQFGVEPNLFDGA